jgi:TonB family protein
MISIGEHDRRYRRRLKILFPIVVSAHLLLFVTLVRIDVVRNIIMCGYAGPPELRPDISIIDDRTVDEEVAEQRNPLVVMNVFIEGLDRPEPDRGSERAPRPAEQPRPSVVAPDIPDDFAFRTYPSRAPVPYRRDYVILRMVKPHYPADALANAEEGYVLVEAYVDSDGTVAEVYVRSSYGRRSFEESALGALRQFLFKPVMERERAISFWVSFLVRYELRP